MHGAAACMCSSPAHPPGGVYLPRSARCQLSYPHARALPHALLQEVALDYIGKRGSTIGATKETRIQVGFHGLMGSWVQPVCMHGPRGVGKRSQLRPRGPAPAAGWGRWQRGGLRARSAGARLARGGAARDPSPDPSTCTCTPSRTAVRTRPAAEGAAAAHWHGGVLRNKKGGWCCARVGRGAGAAAPTTLSLAVGAAVPTGRSPRREAPPATTPVCLKLPVSSSSAQPLALSSRRPTFSATWCTACCWWRWGGARRTTATTTETR